MKRNCLKLTGALLSLALLSACGNLNGKTGTSTTSSGLAASASAGGAAAISSFSPAMGTYNAMPTTVIVNYSSTVLDVAGASAISTYNITCGGNNMASTAVSYVGGATSASITLAPVVGLAEGTVCTFSVSSSLRDGYGNIVAGTHSVNYTYSAAGASPIATGSGSAWNESATVTYTAQIGNPVANYFQGVAANGVLMSGLNVNGGTYVDGISGIWSAGFTTTTTTQGPIQGNSSETFTQLTCPAGYRMTGITGRSGAYIDAIAIICKTQDQSQTYTSSTFGGSGGNAYTLSCPAGQFVTNLDGTSGNYLDDLYLGCR